MQLLAGTGEQLLQQLRSYMHIYHICLLCKTGCCKVSPGASSQSPSSVGIIRERTIAVWPATARG